LGLDGKKKNGQKMMSAENKKPAALTAASLFTAILAFDPGDLRGVIKTH
jgi:hypothetical protein